MIGDILQPTHLLLVLVVALLVLGPKRLPEVSRQLGRGLRDFRAAISGDDSQQHETLHQSSQVYEAPPQPFEHQFAHETTETVASHAPEAAASTETGTNGHALDDPAADEHQFAHQPAAQTPAPSRETSVPGEHVGTDAPVQPAGGTGSGTTGGHEFAYEQTPPADKPADPGH